MEGTGAGSVRPRMRGRLARLHSLRAPAASLLVIAFLLFLVPGTDASTSLGTPIVVTTFPGIAYDFDVGGQRVAWIDSAWVLRSRSFRNAATTSIRYTD